LPAPETLIVRALDCVVAPSSSRATATREYDPAATPDHVYVYGAVESLPTSVEPA
jgi:hypothetical protein